MRAVLRATLTAKPSARWTSVVSKRGRAVGGKVTGRWVVGLVLSGCVMLAALGQAQSAPASAAAVDPRAEVAAALYAASATQAAAERAADVKLRTLHKEIEALRTQVHTGAAQHQADLTAAEEKYVAALASHDRAYAQEIAVFRKTVEDIAATPEGAAALARFNAGDELGALAILDDLRTAHDAARQKRAAIESAAEGRRIATLALEARTKGKLTTAQVIARYEEVTRLDPGVHWDWVELGRLYQDIGNLPAALRAVQAAADTATDDRDRSVGHHAIGEVLVRQGDLPGALTAYRKSQRPAYGASPSARASQLSFTRPTTASPRPCQAAGKKAWSSCPSPPPREKTRNRSS
ncbi:MAG: hypothetical protein E8D41_14515 [Nitrospira sp.]|nr:MAG: hypothetical protein E8D41_14515 [Nitrospira sp.]